MRSTEQALLAFATVELVKKAGWWDDLKSVAARGWSNLTGASPEVPPEMLALRVQQERERSLRSLADRVKGSLREQALAGTVAGGVIGGLGGMAFGPRGGATPEAEAEATKKRQNTALIAALAGAGIGGGLATGRGNQNAFAIWDAAMKVR